MNANHASRVDARQKRQSAQCLSAGVLSDRGSDLRPLSGPYLRLANKLGFVARLSVTSRDSSRHLWPGKAPTTPVGPGIGRLMTAAQRPSADGVIDGATAQGVKPHRTPPFPVSFYRRRPRAAFPPMRRYPQRKALIAGAGRCMSSLKMAPRSSGSVSRSQICTKARTPPGPRPR